MKKRPWKSDSFIRTGLRHTDRSQPCQDYVIVDSTRGAALCDGISRSIQSEKASQIAAKETIAFCREIVGDKLLVKDLISSTDKSKEACQSVCEELAKRIKLKLTNYPQADSTLAFMYMLTDRYAIIGYIGDSAVIVISDTKAKVFTQTRDYGGPTESIAHNRAAELMDIKVIDMEAENVKSFVLTSDGLEDELYTKGNTARVMKACEKYVNALFDPDGHEIVESLLDSVTADGIFDDDISLAVLAREKISLAQEPQWLCKCGHRNPLMVTYCENCDEDYFTLYRHADMSKYPSPWEYFSFLNSHPQEEQRVIGNKTNIKTNAVTSANQTNNDDEQESQRFKATLDLNQCGDTDSKNTEERKQTTMNKRLAIIESAVILLLCGVFVVNTFQMWSISNRLDLMIEKIDALNNSNTSSTIVATESTATPSEVTPTNTDLSSKNLPTESTEPNSTVLNDEETTLSVIGSVMMFSKPNNSDVVVGYITESENPITPIECYSIDGVKWYKIRNSSGIVGWINEQMEITKG